MSVCFEFCVLSEVSATGRTLVQGSHREFGVSECNHETSMMTRPLPTGGGGRQGMGGEGVSSIYALVMILESAT
jgi:hypothetical protein